MGMTSRLAIVELTGLLAVGAARAEHIGTQTADAWTSDRYRWLRFVNRTFVHSEVSAVL
jgi:hypothetical protein